MLTPRPRDEIEAQYAKAERMLLGNRRDGRTATATEPVIAVSGVAHALAWVLGRTPRAPVEWASSSRPRASGTVQRIRPRGSRAASQPRAA